MLLALTALLAVWQTASAIPAYPGRIVCRQPDGTPLVLRNHGDEFGHWTTTEDGRVVRRDDDGFYRVVFGETEESARRSAAARRNAARSIRSAGSGAPSPAIGVRHFLVILVEFSDLSFKSGNDLKAFSDLLNKPGYSVNGATGSARDYYYDNSHGEFEPVFDVYGPVRASKSYSDYGMSDYASAKAVIEGCRLLDDQVDFSRYDEDGDGQVDMVLMYYAGYGEADSPYGDTIWPHESNLETLGLGPVTLDGVQLNTYACTNELNYSNGTKDTLCGIGTACHEFGHALGLPDLYDTNGESNGQAGGMYSYSLMCMGMYNNSGRTPPYFGFEERLLLGWVKESDFREFDETGTYTLPPVNELVVYRTYTDMNGEYFLYENRTKTGWDRFIPEEGLIVCHVDKSSNLVSAGMKQYTAWDTWFTGMNAINCDGSHPCFYIVPAANQKSLDYTNNMGMVRQGVAFPYNQIQSFTPRSWSGETGAIPLDQIAFSNGTVSLHATVPTVRLDFVSIVENGPYRAGDRFTFSLKQPEGVTAPASVVWYFDDEPAGADSVTLTAGAHSVDARLTYADGRESVVTLEIEVRPGQ